MIHWKQALDLETRVAQIILQQEINGVKFDVEKAKEDVRLLDERREGLYGRVRPHLEIEVYLPYKDKAINKPFLKKGGYNTNVWKWAELSNNSTYDDIDWTFSIGGPFTRVEFVEPDIGSRQKLIKQLLKHGWKPTIFTDKGQPKLTIKGEPVDSLLKIKGDVGKDIAMWYTYGHRRSQILGWIRDIRDDGRLTAAADTVGTNTVRFRHKTVVNCPKAKPDIIFGYEMRDLFIADDDTYLVGHDAAGLEARMMAHYTTPYDGGEFAHELLHGDIHSKNTRIFFPEETEGLSRGDEGFDLYRDGCSKNGFYGLVYGAQPTKLASTLGVKKKRGRELFRAFWRENYALGKLRDSVIKMAESKGWIPGLDGRKIYIRSSHSALNALFQSAGAIVMKNSMVILDHWAKQEGLDFKKVIDMHDESQSEVPRDAIKLFEFDTKEEAESIITDGTLWMKPSLTNYSRWRVGYSRYGELAVESIVRAGTYLKLRCPLDADYKIGYSWAETH